MQLLKEGDVNAKKIIKASGVDKGNAYRRILYSVLRDVCGKCFLKHTLTGEIFSLSQEEFHFLTTVKGKTISGTEIVNAGMEKLVYEGFLIPAGNNEYNLYCLVRMALKNAKQRKKGIGTYTIFPTLACNAKCIYCFEEHMDKPSMSQETLEQVVEYIVKTKREGKIHIRWFGGEPLVAVDRITEISRKLTELGVEFDSSMVTNGVLMTKGLMETAINEWHLMSVQISVDGAKKDYEARKCYCNPKIHNYESMLEAVRVFVDADLQVTVRCNYDEENLPRVREFIDELYASCGKPKNMSLYFAMLYEARKKANSEILYKKMMELNDYLQEKGITSILSKDTPYRFKCHHCMADSDGTKVVIDPNGDLYHCEELPEGDKIGNIRDGDIVIGNKVGSGEIDEKCKACPYLAECTPFFSKGCPAYYKQCREFKDVETEQLFKLFA